MIHGIHKIFFFFFFLISFQLESKALDGKSAIISILDKITAKVNNFEINVNESLVFETLEIKIFACYKTPPNEVPENYALLRIWDEIEDKKEKLVYQGWMISSSPSSSPFEHPIYDIWINECKLNKY